VDPAALTCASANSSRRAGSVAGAGRTRIMRVAPDDKKRPRLGSCWGAGVLLGCSVPSAWATGRLARLVSARKRPQRPVRDAPGTLSYAPLQARLRRPSLRGAQRLKASVTPLRTLVEPARRVLRPHLQSPLPPARHQRRRDLDQSPPQGRPVLRCRRCPSTFSRNQFVRLYASTLSASTSRSRPPRATGCGRREVVLLSLMMFSSRLRLL